MAALGELVMEMIKDLRVEGIGPQKGWLMAKQFDQEEDTARTSRKETKKREAQPFPWTITLISYLYFKVFGQTPPSCLLLSFSLLLFPWVVVV